MEKRGLCDSCSNAKRCVLASRFPVLECEEYTDRLPKASSKRKKTC